MVAISRGGAAPPEPTPAELEKYLVKWEEHRVYPLQERALDRLFRELCPENADLADVMLKASVLNDFYSTCIFDIAPIAAHIRALDIDERLECGDLRLVGDIACVDMGGGSTRRLYSFASKYCSWHRPAAYPMLDKYVRAVLCHFRNRDSFAEFKNNELYDYGLFDYERFVQITYDFRGYYGLEGYGVKDLDKYLWQLGNEYFPNAQ